jgi:hypothetical protein
MRVREIWICCSSRSSSSLNFSFMPFWLIAVAAREAGSCEPRAEVFPLRRSSSSARRMTAFEESSPCPSRM